MLVCQRAMGKRQTERQTQGQGDRNRKAESKTSQNSINAFGFINRKI